MFDIGAVELLLVAMVALIVIGPKDLPVAMRTAGQWVGKIRGMTRHFRIGIDAMIREADVQEQEKNWAEKNAQIMRDHPPGSEVEESRPADEIPMDGQMKPLSDEPSTDEPIGEDRSSGTSAEPDLFESPPTAAGIPAKDGKS